MTSIKTELRTFSNEQGHSPKGRIATETKVAFLRVNPATARALAIEAGIPVGKRGRISAETFEAIAQTV